MCTSQRNHDAAKSVLFSRRSSVFSGLVLARVLFYPAGGLAEEQTVKYEDSKNGFSLALPNDFEKKDKAGATVLFQDPSRTSTQVGVTVNPVRVRTLKEFGSLESVGEKLLQAEKGKESTLDCTLLYQRERTSPAGAIFYEYGYELDSTRGRKLVQTSVTIENSKLYILNATVKCEKDGCDGFEETISKLRETAGSFEVSSS